MPGMKTNPIPEYPKGLVLWIIINHTKFDTILGVEEYEYREGAEVDENKIKDALEKFYIDLRIWKDMTLHEIKKKLLDIKNEANSGPNKFAGLVIMGMSHGEQINGVDMLVTKDCELLSTEFIKEIFHNCNCPGFQNKPKAFLFNMCRGSGKNINLTKKLETSKSICNDALSSSIHQRASKCDFDPESIEFKKGDYLIAHSTISGFVSNRHRRFGSIFVQEITKAINQYMGKGQNHFEEVVRIACSSSSWHQYSGEKAPQLPEYTTTLRAHFKFVLKSKQFYNKFFYFLLVLNLQIILS